MPQRYKKEDYNPRSFTINVSYKLFLDPLDRRKGNIAQLRHIPHTLTPPQQFDDFGVFLLLLLTGLDAALFPPHLHAFLLRQLAPLGQAKKDVLPLLLRTETEATDVDCHNAIHLTIPKQGQPREDYSAKGHELNRPEFKKVYDYCRKHRHDVDKVLFLRWDRYSRNVEFAFAYKRKLIDELHIEINAMESPIDFNSGDWATLLGLYCGTAHSEDVKISKRTKDGIHGTLLKGKWPHRAPLGYLNVRRTKHDCWIEVDPDTGPLVQRLFSEVALGLEVPTIIGRRIFPTLASTSLFHLLRNPFYAGLIHVNAYNGDPEQDVKGIHEALVGKRTFDAVQEVLDGKKKDTPKMGKTANPVLYLRRYLTCPVCGTPLTGAVSRGRGGLYAYYFCNRDHKHFNVRADAVNEGFVKYVSKLKPNRAVLELYNEVLQDIRGERVRNNHAQADKLEADVVSLEERVNRVNDLYFDGKLSTADRDKNIACYTEQIEHLKYQIGSLRMSADLKMREKLTYSLNLISNLGKFFQSATCEVKSKLLGSIFPEKLLFDGKNYRTHSFNGMLNLIFKETKHLQGNKKESDSKKRSQTHLGCDVGLEPTTPRTTIWCSTN